MSGGPPKWSRGPLESLEKGVGCRYFDSRGGAQCPAGGWRTWRKSHGSDLLPPLLRSGEIEIGPWGRPRASPNNRNGEFQAVSMGPHHTLKGMVGASRDAIGWLQPGGRPPPRVRQSTGLPLLPATFPPTVAFESPQPAPSDREAGFLPAIQSDARRMAAGLHAHLRGVPHGPSCSGHALALHGGAE